MLQFKILARSTNDRNPPRNISFLGGSIIFPVPHPAKEAGIVPKVRLRNRPLQRVGPDGRAVVHVHAPVRRRRLHDVPVRHLVTAHALPNVAMEDETVVAQREVERLAISSSLDLHVLEVPEGDLCEVGRAPSRDLPAGHAAESLGVVEI